MQKLLGTRWTTVRFKKICTISPFISYKGNLSLRFLLSSSLLHNSYIRPRALFMPHPLRHFIHPYRLHQTERSRLTYLKIFQNVSMCTVISSHMCKLYTLVELCSASMNFIKLIFFVQNDKATFTFLDLVLLFFLRWMQCGQDLHYFAILHSV